MHHERSGVIFATSDVGTLKDPGLTDARYALTATCQLSLLVSLTARPNGPRQNSPPSPLGEPSAPAESFASVTGGGLAVVGVATRRKKIERTDLHRTSPAVISTDAVNDPFSAKRRF